VRVTGERDDVPKSLICPKDTPAPSREELAVCLVECLSDTFDGDLSFEGSSGKAVDRAMPSIYFIARCAGVLENKKENIDISDHPLRVADER